MKLNPNHVGLTLGAAISIWHFVWGLLVAGGLATVLIEFIYNIHFLNNPFTVQPFDLVKWVTLVAVTFIVGYAMGYVFTLLWNKLHK